MDKRIIMIAALALAAVACGDDDEGGDDGVIIKTDATVQQPVDASVGIDSSITPTTDASTAGDGSTPAVKGAPGCFSGTPTTSLQFLNACAEGYREFNNSTRIPGFTGTLPPL